MRLLYVVHQFFPECYSGTEQYCLAAAREGRRRGHDVVILTLDPDFGQGDEPVLVADRPFDGFQVLRLRHWWALQANEVRLDYENPLVAARFGQLLRELRPDAVHFFHLRRLGADWIEVAKAAGVRSVVHLMDYWYLCPRYTLRRSDGSLCEGPPDGGLGCIPCHHPQLGAWLDPEAGPAAVALANAQLGGSLYSNRPAQVAALLQRPTALRQRLERADVVIAPSRFLASVFEQNGFPRGRIEVVPYGLEPGRVDRVAVDRPRAPLRLGFCGVLSPWKGLDVAVEAVRTMAGDFTFTVHGRTWEPEFGDYIKRLLARAEADPRITFAGKYDLGELTAVLAGIDLLVVPSTWYENTPFVILEAFEAGVPVVASDLGGMSELIRPGENGFLFTASDPGALAAVLQRCVDDPSTVAALQPAAPGTIADNFERFLAAYRAA
ncbi:MAG: glycosyltransferase family 4 protein [Planctomycetota bacterium]